MASTQAQKDASKRWRQRHTEKAKAWQKTEKRKQYEREYYKTHKSKYASRDKAWSEANRDRRVAYTLKYRAKNPQHYKDYMRAWNEQHQELRKRYRTERKIEKPNYYRAYYEKNKHLVLVNGQKQRARRMLAAVNLRGIKDFRDAVKSKKFAFCYHCGRRILSSSVHFDHIIPLIKGGSHSVENLCVSCSDCNWSKGAKTLAQWSRIGQQVLEL